jgi:uncharacterized protein with FMN-binding domain
MKSGRRPKKHQARSVPTPAAPAKKRRKGKLSGGIIALSSAAIVSIYALGRANTSAGSEQAFVDAPTAAAPVVARAGGATPAAPTTATAGARPAPGAAPSSTQSAPTPAAAYKDGTYAGNGNSRHGGMQVTVVIKGGKIASANVTSCGTRYPCSDVNSLVRAAVSKQVVPVNHVSGSTDSSQAYKQALTNALKQAKA